MLAHLVITPHVNIHSNFPTINFNEAIIDDLIYF